MADEQIAPNRLVRHVGDGRWEPVGPCLPGGVQVGVDGGAPPKGSCVATAVNVDLGVQVGDRMVRDEQAVEFVAKVDTGIVHRLSVDQIKEREGDKIPESCIEVWITWPVESGSDRPMTESEAEVFRLLVEMLVGDAVRELG